jgi:restriction system protein
MALWVARAGKYGERESYALANNVVTVGWEHVEDLTAIGDRDSLLPLLLKTYPEENPNTVKNWETQLWAFTNRFEVGDIVALPLKTQSAVAFGRITGPYRFVADAPEEAKHQRPVEWLATDVPRSKIDSDLRFSIGGAMTVFEVRRNNAEVRIRAMLEGKSAPQTPQANGDDDASPSDAGAFIDLASQATDQIIDFISRYFGGHDLARLVAAVLRAQGYTARVSPPGADGGVDIVAGRGPMGFDAPRLCVQVKSGDYRVDVKELRELQGVMKNYRAEQGLIVSWGGFKQSVVQEARQLYFEIRLWDQTDLVQAVQEAYERLDDQLQAELPLKRTWVLLVEEG